MVYVIEQYWTDVTQRFAMASDVLNIRRRTC